MKTTLGHFQALPNVRQIPQHLVGIHIHHRRANRYRQHKILTLIARTVTTRTRLTVLRLVLTLETVINQGVQRIVRLQIYGATITPVTAIGTAKRNELFAAKRTTSSQCRPQRSP